MNKNYALLLAVIILASLQGFSQNTIAQWNFNGASATTVPGGISSPAVAVGEGSAEVVGSLTTLFNGGNASGGTTETEPAATNFAWQSTNYAALGTENKGRGVQFNVSTVFHSGITFKFEQRLSNKAANTYVVQYTTDRTATTPVWVEAQTFTFTPLADGTGDTWYNGRTVDLSAVTALDGNPNVAFRVVAAFDPTTSNYLAARSTSAYDGTGTVRFDMVTITSNAMLGVQQHDMASHAFTISPNPSNGNVSFNQAYDITVMDTAGKTILVQKNASSLNTGVLHSGVYVVKTSTGETKKLIVN